MKAPKEAFVGILVGAALSGALGLAFVLGGADPLTTCAWLCLAPLLAGTVITVGYVLFEVAG